MRPALHGDRVLVEVGAPARRGRTEGRVVRVLERGTKRVVGVLRRGRTTAVLVPQDPRLTVPHRRPARRRRRRPPTATWWSPRSSATPARRPTPRRASPRVLGPAADPRVETEAVIHAHGLPARVPAPTSRAAARRVPATVAARGARRAASTSATLPIVTIDGENARDFDDAVLVERDGRGYRLTVAVADVAHYVPAGERRSTARRGRAARASTSPTASIPMLPEALSNGICSLGPGEDRLVKVVRLELDAAGRVTRRTLRRGVIRSAARLTYTEVRQALVDRDPTVRARLGPLLAPLERAEELARLLIARRRRARGASTSTCPRRRSCSTSAAGPSSIVRAERSIAHRMIEEFMLAANEAVARELARRKIAVLHRVHEAAGAATRVAELARFLEGFGLRLAPRGRPRRRPRPSRRCSSRSPAGPRSGSSTPSLLRTHAAGALRAEPLGHFGLATECYTHFTSPIRRYPDLVVHRLLDVALAAAAACRPTWPRSPRRRRGASAWRWTPSARSCS